MQTRALCYVDDLLDGWQCLMDHAPERLHGPVNIGNPVETPMRHLAEKILDKVGSSSRYVFAPPPACRTSG